MMAENFNSLNSKPFTFREDFETRNERKFIMNELKMIASDSIRFSIAFMYHLKFCKNKSISNFCPDCGFNKRRLEEIERKKLETHINKLKSLRENRI